MPPITPSIIPRRASQFLGPEFNSFLFAPVGADRYGAQLSVVSALARLDLDAWAEAASLARLPRDVAVRKLAANLAKFDEIPRIAQESGAIAARLIGLLPGRASPGEQEAIPAFRWAGPGGAGLLFLMALGLVLGVQYARLGSQAPAAPDHGLAAQAAMASPSPPASPPPSQPASSHLPAQP
jgi:hypothetical protein